MSDPDPYYEGPWWKDPEYHFGGAMMGLMLGLMGLGWYFVEEAQAAPLDSSDYELIVMDRADPRDPLAIKRFISVSDCRKERQWLMSLLERTNAHPTWIVCTKEGANGS